MMTDLVGYVNKSVVLANESWSSISSEAFNEKITISQRYLREIDLSLDEMLKLLNSVKDNELNESIDELSANTDNACS